VLRLIILKIVKSKKSIKNTQINSKKFPSLLILKNLNLRKYSKRKYRFVFVGGLDKAHYLKELIFNKSN
jgi:hypothetical protein